MPLLRLRLPMARWTVLLRAGLLTQLEAFTWYARLREAALDEAVEKPYRMVEGHAQQAATARAAKRGRPHAEPPEVRLPPIEPAEPFYGRQPLRLFPLSPRRLGELELTSLEIYDDGIAVGRHHRNPPPGWLPLIELCDDAGTAYQLVGGASHGGPGVHLAVMWGENVFAPTPPPEATLLRISAEKAVVEFPLASKPPQGRSSALPPKRRS